MDTLFDFDKLGSVSKFRADVFTNEDGADAFVLALALAYNDLKDANWLSEVLRRGRPEDTSDSDVTAVNGQWQGMLENASRRTISILHELLQAIEVSKKKGVFEDRFFKLALANCSAEQQDAWAGLVELAQQRKADANPVRDYLAWVRHNLSYHYYQPKMLLRGYRHVFEEMPRTKFNEAAMFSSGTTMAATRFFFADAAAQAAHRLGSDVPDDIGKLSSRYANDVNSALHGIVQYYIINKLESLTGRSRHGGRLR